MIKDEWIEQLAFGRTTPKLTSCLGLYLSSEEMVLSEVRMSSGKVVVDQIIKVPVPAQAPASGEPRTAGALNVELLANSAKLADALKAAMKGSVWKSNYWVVSLSQNLGLVRYFIMPNMDRRYWNTAIPAEAKKHIPLPFSELVHDFQVRSFHAGTETRERLGVLFAVTYRNNLLGIQALSEKIGLKLLGIEAVSCSVERLWDHLQAPGAKPGACVRIHFDGRDCRLLASDQGWPILLREIRFEGEPKPAEARKVDLSGCIDFSKKQLAMAEPREIRISGSVPEIEGWKESFTQEIGLQAVGVQDSLKKAGLKTETWGGYASIGGAMGYLASSAFSLDLTQAKKAMETDRKVAKTFFAAAMVLSAWFLLVAARQYIHLLSVSGKYNAVQRRQLEVPEFQNKTSDQIRSLVEELQKRVNGLGAFARSDLKVTYLLEDIAAGVPDQLWVTQINYANAISGETYSEAGTLGMTGHARASGIVEEQDLAVQFGERLKSNQRFSRLFVCGAPSVQTNASSSGGGFGGMGGGGSGQERTTFTIDCRVRKS